MELSHLIIVLILLGCMATYIPVFKCLFFTAVLGFVLFTDLPVLLLAPALYRSLDNFALIVVLFFTLCGNIMTAGTIVEKLIKVANALVSWLPGGLGMAEFWPAAFLVPYPVQRSPRLWPWAAL